MHRYTDTSVWYRIDTEVQFSTHTQKDIHDDTRPGYQLYMYVYDSFVQFVFVPL